VDAASDPATEAAGGTESPAEEAEVEAVESADDPDAIMAATSCDGDELRKRKMAAREP
jgi:hypothetical protein